MNLGISKGMTANATRFMWILVHHVVNEIRSNWSSASIARMAAISPGDDVCLLMMFESSFTQSAFETVVHVMHHKYVQPTSQLIILNMHDNFSKVLNLQLSKVLHEMGSCSTYTTREAPAQSVVASEEGRASASLLAPKHPRRAPTRPQHLYGNFAISKDTSNAVAQNINLRYSAADMCSSRL